MPRKITVNCPQCGKPLSATIFASVNSEYTDDLAMKIMSGELFDVECPHCQFVSHLEYDLLYHDMNNGAMIWVVHKHSPDYEARISEIRSGRKLPYKVLRIVEDMNALKEKVSCLESKRDDRIIELCKAFTVNDLKFEHPDFDIKDAFYTAVSGKELIYLFGNDDREMCCALPDKLYDVLKEAYENSPYAAQCDSDYAIVDQGWAEEILLPLMKAKTEGIHTATEEKTSEPKPVVPPKKLCPKCNSELPEGSAFCHRCGTQLSPAAISIPLPSDGKTEEVRSEAEITEEERESEQEKQQRQEAPERQRIAEIQNERNLAILKRLATTEADNQKKKKRKTMIICAVAVIVAVFLVKGIMDTVHNNQPRNFATEAMNEDYRNVYADIVSMEPEYFVYTSYNNRPYSISQIICKCVTVEGKTIWAAVYMWEYPGGSTIEEQNEPQYYSKSNPKRIVGRVETAGQIMDELKREIGNIFVLDVTERITE